MAVNSFIELLGAKIARWEEGLCEWELDIAPHHLNSQGSLHGGVIATLLDDACSYSGFYQKAGNPVGRAVTVSLTVNYLAKESIGRVIAKGRCIGGGKRIYFAEGKLVSEGGIILAQASGSFRRQTK